MTRSIMDSSSGFNFQNLPDYKFSSSDNAEIKANLTKWSMSDGLMLQAYSFDKPFRKYNERDFIVEFFGCPNVVSTLLKSTPSHTFSPLGVPGEVVKFSEVKCTFTTLQIFDKLKEDKKVVRPSGSIVKCVPHYISGCIDGSDKTFEMEIADNLRKFILADATDDDIYDWDDIGEVLTQAEKKEFIFLLFSHLVIGGSLCQYEDHIEPYIEATKLLYKDLIAVARAQELAGGGDGDKLKVISFVYKIHSVSRGNVGSTDLLFHRQYLNNFFYLVINPLKQLCFTIYYHV